MTPSTDLPQERSTLPVRYCIEAQADNCAGLDIADRNLRKRYRVGGHRHHHEAWSK